MIKALLNFILFSGLLYFIYVLLFRKLSFFQINRWVLLLIPLISLSIPFLAPLFNDPFLEATGFNTNLLPIDILANGQQLHQPTSSTNSWVVIYLLGLIFSLVVTVFGLYKIFKIIRNKEH